MNKKDNKPHSFRWRLLHGLFETFQKAAKDSDQSANQLLTSLAKKHLTQKGYLPRKNKDS